MSTRRFRRRVSLAIIILFILSACGNSPAADKLDITATFLASDTPAPTVTPEPTATNTVLPSLTPTDTQTPIPRPETIPGPEVPQFLYIPSGTSLHEWEGIPIVQEVVHGQEAYDGYYYSADLHVNVIKEYYLEQLGQEGWYLAGIGESERGHILMIFQRGSDQIEITLYNFYTGAVDPNSPVQIPPSNVLLVKKGTDN